MKKSMMLRTAVLAAALTAAFGMTAFAAGHWEKDATGYWWQEEDGSYPASCWKWLDWNNDGQAESYYFDANGYMAVNTTVDGYTVNGDGAWVVDGVVQTQQAEAQAPAEQAQETADQNAVGIAGKYKAIRSEQRYRSEPWVAYEPEADSFLVVSMLDENTLEIIEQIGGYESNYKPVRAADGRWLYDDGEYLHYYEFTDGQVKHEFRYPTEELNEMYSISNTYYEKVE